MVLVSKKGLQFKPNPNVRRKREEVELPPRKKRRVELDEEEDVSLSGLDEEIDQMMDDDGTPSDALGDGGERLGASRNSTVSKDRNSTVSNDLIVLEDLNVRENGETVDNEGEKESTLDIPKRVVINVDLEPEKEVRTLKSLIQAVSKGKIPNLQPLSEDTNKLLRTTYNQYHAERKRKDNERRGIKNDEQVQGSVQEEDRSEISVDQVVEERSNPINVNVNDDDDDFEEIDDMFGADFEQDNGSGVNLVSFRNGQAIIRPDFVVDDQDPIDYGNYARTVEHHGQHRYITSRAFNRNPVGKKWSEEELEDFYEGLRQFGTNFSMISRFFPHRSRREVKLKFKRLEKEFPEKIDKLLLSRTKIDPAKFREKSDLKDLIHNVTRPVYDPLNDPEQREVETRKDDNEDEWEEVPSNFSSNVETQKEHMFQPAPAVPTTSQSFTFSDEDEDFADLDI